MKCSVAMQCVLVPAVVVCLCTLAVAEETERHLTAAFAWLEQAQDSESGFWGPDPVRDTAAVLQTVQLFPASGIDVSAAQEYLSAQQPVSSDYLARKNMALAGNAHGVELDVAELLLRQNSDGGFGFSDGYPSSPIDSILALEALVLAGVDDDKVIGSALKYLTALQHSSGAFSYDRSGPASLEVTCRAVLAMQRVQPRYNLSSFIVQAAGFINTQHNVDGGFGEDGSTVVETAFAIRALQAAGSKAQAVLEARTYLISVQNPVDGSWNGRAQDTACALAALHASAGIDRANLQVHPSGISLQPSYPAAGQQVTVSCEVRNIGSRAAENIEVELYLGDPAAGGQFFDSGSIASLEAGASADVQWTFMLTDEPGHAALYVIVDPRNLISEISNADNVAIKNFTSGTLPDLVIARIDPSTPSPQSDVPFTLSSTVKNISESDAGPVTVGLYQGDPDVTSPLLEVALNNVCGGCSGRADFELTLPAGTHEYVVSVSADAAVVEQDFDNNDRSCTFTVAPGMIRGLDLEITQSGIVFSPSHPLEDEPIRVSAAIRNRGDVAARDAVVELYAVDALHSSSLLHTFSGVDVAAKGSVTLTLDGVRLDAGTYDMYVIVSASPAQQDEAPDNNIAFKALHVFDSQDFVDLAVDDFILSPAMPHAGDPVFVRFRITNHGNVGFAGITFGLYDGDPRSNGTLVLDSLQRLSFLGAGQSMYASGVFGTAGRGGEQTLYVFVDAEQAVEEVDEENNITSGAFTVVHDPGPDIVINAGGLEFSPAQPSVDDALRIYCTVCNQGSRPIVDSFDAALYVGQPQGAAQPLAVATIDSLEANACVRIAFTAQAALFAASQGIFAHADCQNAIVETNEYNNTVSMDIPVSSPDLSISDEDLSIESDPLLPGQPFAFNAVIHNVGLIDARDVAVTVFNGPPENAQERARLSLPLIAAGSSETAVFSISLPAGSHTLYVVIDPDGYVAESDRANNSASIAVNVGLPDEDHVLDLAALRVRLNSNNLPDSAAITVRVCNDGTVDVDPGIDVAFYSGDPAAGAILLGVEHTVSALPAGAYEDVTFVWNNPAEGDYTLFIVVDDDRTGQGQLTEFNEANNTVVASVAITYSANPKDTAVSQGSQWLVGHQHHLGGWEAFTPARANAATLQALHISGLYQDSEFSDMYATILQRVHETQATNGSWENSVSSTADSVLALLAVGEDNLLPAIRNAVIWMKRVQQEDGGWNNSPPQTGHAVWVLMAAGASRNDHEVQAARQWLLDTCNPDGFWGTQVGEASGLWTLHYPVVALQLACDESDSVARATITKAVNWYKANREGGVDLTDAYLNMLFYSGRNAGDIAATMGALKGLQSSNGGWVEGSVSSTPLEDPRFTAQAVISLYLHSQTGGGAAIRKAFRWLKTMMIEPAGDLQYPYDQASPTSSALLALNSVNGNGENNETIREALTRLVNTQKSNGNWHLQLSMIPIHHLTAGAAVLKALAETELVVTGTRSAVSKVVDFLFRYQNNDGGWYRTSYAGRSEVSSTIVSLLGLLSDSVILTAGQRTDVQQAIEWLLQQKTAAANWETISYTANIVTIFARFGGYQSEIDEAVAWLKQRQNPDGGWGEYESTIQITAGVVLALIQTGNQGTETARAVQWLLAVQNIDGGWPILAGISNSSTITTAFALHAVALADYTPGPQIAISFDKSAYQPGEKVTVSVEPKSDSFQVQQVSGTITEYEGDSQSIAFAKVGRNFVGTHVLSAGHTAGTDIVSIEAQTLEGVSGYGVGTFVVENKSDGFADLSVAGPDIMFSPEEPDEGRVVLMAARVHNIGLAASRQTTVRFLHGTQQIGVEQTLSSLAPGASDIVFMQWDTRGQLGRNYIHVVLDPDRLVADADRVNNRAMRPIDVAARSLPDLEVRDSDVSFANASPVEGAAVEVSATVRNLGADVDGVVVHFYEGSVEPENLIAERIVSTIVPFGGSATVSAVFDTAGRTGQRSIIVNADPGNVIREQNEANNSGAARLNVIPGGLALELSLDRESYAHADDVLITACITNSFAVERTVQLDVAIRDGNGTVAAESAQGVVVVLPPGGTEVIDDLVWNTGSVMSGEWSVSATLFEDAQRRAGAVAGFTIIADKGIAAAINSDRQVYYDHEQVVVSSGVRSYSPNYAFTDLSALVEIISPDGQTLHANTYDIPLLHPLASTSWEESWNTALNSPGLYVFNLDIMQEGSLIASDAAYITIANSASGERGLSAFLNVEPARVHRGQDVALSYGVRNSGNTVLDETALVFKAVNVTMQQETTVFETACMFEGNDCSGTGVLDSSDLACGDYVIIMSALVDGTAHNLAFAPLSIVNRCPVTVSGEDVLAHVGDFVQLNGSGSYDFDGDSLSYSWEKASAPEESNAELVGPGLYNPVLHIDRHGTYELRLSVSDSMCWSPPDSVLVSTENRPPVAVAGESLLVDVNEKVQLDGSASHDPDGDLIERYEWTMVSRPENSAAGLSDRFAPNPVFTADVPGEYRLQLIVCDFEYASDPVAVEVTTHNRRPVADSGPDREVTAGDAVQLDASASHDPDADPLTCGWSILSAPQGSMAVISDSAAPAPVFTADKSGTYIVQLIVNDGELDSIPDTCTITIRSLPPECTDDLGVAQQYSIFALGEVTSQHSSVSGRIAAGGDAELNNVVMGTHVPHGAPEEPVLVSGGDIVYSSGVVHRGSIIAAGSVEGVAGKVRRTMARGATIMGNAELPCDFMQESSRLRKLSARLGGFSPTGTAESMAGTLALRGDGSSPIQIFNITSQQARRARSLHLSNIPRNATVIINISGQQAEVSHIGMAVQGCLTGRVLFNFFEARSLEFTAGALKGSVLAPLAQLTGSSGILFGSAVVGAWQGSMNVGHEPFIGILPKCEP